MGDGRSRVGEPDQIAWSQLPRWYWRPVTRLVVRRMAESNRAARRDVHREHDEPGAVEPNLLAVVDCGTTDALPARRTEVVAARPRVGRAEVLPCGGNLTRGERTLASVGRGGPCKVGRSVQDR